MFLFLSFFSFLGEKTCMGCAKGPPLTRAPAPRPLEALPTGSWLASLTSRVCLYVDDLYHIRSYAYIIYILYISDVCCVNTRSI